MQPLRRGFTRHQQQGQLRRIVVAQAQGQVQAIHAVGQAVVADQGLQRHGASSGLSEGGDGLRLVAGNQHLHAVGSQKRHHGVANVGFILDQQHPLWQHQRQVLGRDWRRYRSLAPRLGRRSGRRLRHWEFHAKTAPPVELGMKLHRVVEKSRQPPHDRQPNAQALGAVTPRVVDLVELLEDQLLVFGRNANAGVDHVDPHLGASRRFARARHPRHHQHTALRGVFDGVFNQVGQQALQQVGVGNDPQRRCAQAQLQAFLFGKRRAHRVDGLQHGVDRDRAQVGRDHAGVQPRDVQHGVQRGAQGVHGAHQARRVGVLGLALQRLLHHRAKQGNGMQGLAQVMAGRGEEAGFFVTDALGFGHLVRQFLGQRLFLKAHEQGFGELAVLLAGKVQSGTQVQRTASRQKQVDRVGAPGQGRDQPHQHGHHKAQNRAPTRHHGRNARACQAQHHQHHQGGQGEAVSRHEQPGCQPPDTAVEQQLAAVPAGPEFTACGRLRVSVVGGEQRVTQQLHQVQTEPRQHHGVAQAPVIDGAQGPGQQGVGQR